MPNTPTFYRLRIRNAADSADALVLTSVRGGTNPYLAGPPTGDGQELDPLTGQLRIGSYSVQVADAATGTDGTGTVRVLTNILYDNGRIAILSRRAFVESSPDGSTWNAYYAGYVLGVRQVDAITYSIELGDTRRIERNHRIFTGSRTAFGPGLPTEASEFPQRGCLLGGPIIGGWGSIADSGGWEFTVANTLPDGLTDGGLIVLSFVAGSVPPLFARQRTLGAGNDANTLRGYTQRILQPFAEPTYAIGDVAPFLTDFSLGQPVIYPSLTVTIDDGVQVLDGTLVQGIGDTTYVRVADISLAPADGTAVRVRIFQTEVSPQSPLYFDLHPVDVVTKLYDTVGIAYDAASASTLKTALGDTLRYACRITEPAVMQDWLERSIFGPFGFGVRMNASGDYEFTLLRRALAAAPVTTIDTDGIVQEPLPPVFEVDESSIVTALRYTYPVYAVNTQPITATPIPPPDNVVVGSVTKVYENGDTSVFSTREVEWRFAGIVHDLNGVVTAFDSFITGTNVEVFNRFGRGAPRGELVVYRGATGDSLYPGDECFVDVSHYPNNNYRIGESSVGPRIMQIVRRTEQPETVTYLVEDVGSDLQPVTPAAVITIAASTVAPRTVAQFTVTNAAAINATNVLTTAIEWRTGSTGGGTLFTRYSPNTVPTGAVLLPPVAPGSVVEVRARTEQAGRRASAWTAWQTVTLTAFAAPSAVNATGITAESVTVTWTNATTEDAVRVFIAPGLVAPADWAPSAVRTFPPASTRAVIRGYGAGSDFIVGVAHVDVSSGALSAVTTDTFSVATDSIQADGLEALLVIPCAEDAQFQTGIALAIYPSDSAYAVEIQRATATGGVSGGVTPIAFGPIASLYPIGPNPFGNFATIATVPGQTEVYVDVLPSDGALRFYRARHVVPGLINSEWTQAVSSVPGGVPDTVARPNIGPTLVASATPGTIAYIITYTSNANVSVSVDGGAFVDAPDSPFSVLRTASDQSYVLKATLNGQSLTVPFVIPAYTTPPATPPSFLTFANVTTVTPACGVNWEATASWTIADDDNTLYYVDVVDSLGNVYFGAENLDCVASGSFTYVGQPGDPMFTDVTQTFPAQARIRVRANGAVIDTTALITVTQQNGVAC